MNPNTHGQFQGSASIFSSIVENAIDAIIVITDRGIMRMVNPAACDMFIYTESELLNQNVKMLMPDFHSTHHDQYLSNYIETGHAKIIGIGREVMGLRKDGSTFPARLAVSEVMSNGQRYFAGFLNDLSQIKEAEASILRLNEELEETVVARTDELSKAVNTLLEINKKLEHEIKEREAVELELIRSQEDLRTALTQEKELNELKSRFVSMASHEFRTPLSTILSSSALIGRYTKGAEQQPKRDKHLHRIKTAVKGLNSILNDFLSLSKIEEGRIPLNMLKYKVGEICNEVIDDIEGLLKKNQTIEFHDSSGDCELYTDKNVFKNILFNLTSNAIKYSPDNTVIEFISSLEGDILRIDIVDKGIGIPKHEQKHLFSRFFRASNVTNIQGTGLGLNIVVGYVEMLNGAISYESEEEKGTTFTLRIPIGKESNG